MKRKISKLLGGLHEEAAACKLCGTYLLEEGGQLTCPHCGFVTGTESYVFNLAEPEGGRGGAKDSGLATLPTSTQEQLDPDLGNGEGPRVGTELLEDEGKQSEAVTGTQEELDAGTSVFTLDRLGVRELLAKQPELLEPGLRLATNKKGESIGGGLSTAVGEIDLLVRDGSGAFVVVTVLRRGQREDLVAGTLQRIGWVRKHLAKGKHKVRGIVLLEHAPENLDYAAAAVAGTIAIKTYRLALAFDDVEV